MRPRRVLLMYITEVSGHHSATLAIEKAIKIIAPETQVMNINAFNYTNPISERVVNRLYMSVIKRTPKIWDYLYDNPVIARKLERVKNSIHKFNSPKLKRLFDRFQPDVVACSQAFPCGMCADYKKNTGAALRLIAVLTDYIPHSYWMYDTIDYYITPSEDVGLRLLDKGVPREKIKPFGIPFDPKFSEQLDAQTLFTKLGLDCSRKTILLMGGGHGLGPMQRILRSLEKVRHPLQCLIVAGTNEKLYSSLEKVSAKSRHKMHLFKYVSNIHELMRVSDVIVTKPGGVTTSEVLSLRLPMVIVKPLPGQEEHNAAYLVEKGAAVRIDNPEWMHLLIDDLLSNPKSMDDLKRAAAGIGKPNASMDIARFILGGMDV
jgi:processive 1,2-diacylglycerol beta-glucosyltransferase